MKFKKKNKKIEDKVEYDFKISTIPESFYGGADPQIYRSQKPVKEHTLIPEKEIVAEKKEDPKTPVPATPRKKKSKKKILIILAVIFLLFVASVSYYYINQAKINGDGRPTIPEYIMGCMNNTAVNYNPKATKDDGSCVYPVLGCTDQEALNFNKNATQDDGTCEYEPEIIPPPPTTTPTTTVIKLEFPSEILSDSADTDSDSLTDMEEELFSTEVETWDTDGDGYYDGQEIYNLYSPTGGAPTKLIDSGLVREYVNPRWDYRLYHPSGWDAASVTDEANQVLFSSITGDFVEVVALEKPTKQSFTAWFAMEADGQSYANLKKITNRFKEDGMTRNDDLVAYFTLPNAVFVIIYHPGTTGDIPFRHVMQMIVQSFRPTKTNVQIPEQVPLPAPGESDEDSEAVEEGRSDIPVEDE